MLPDLMLDTRLGSYLIQKRLGSGGMADVYRAVDERQNRPVALKILRRNWVENADVRRRFDTEARVAQTLRHPCIVPVFDSGIIDDHPYIAMAYMPGGTLAEYFHQHEKLNTQEAVRLLRRVGSAVDYAHSKQVIHRDIKLENILLDRNGEALLADFGLAKVTDATRMTVSGSSMGTPMYMSPEQIMGSVDINHRADLYALAVIAYLLVVGQFPFAADNIAAVIHRHLYESPPPPGKLNPALPPAIDSVLLRALSKNPGDRYPSADALLEAYAHALSNINQDVVIDLAQHTDHVSPPQRSKAETPDEVYKRALTAATTDDAIMLLRQVLKLDPFHLQANRLLMRMEGPRPGTGGSGEIGKMITPPVKASNGFERKLQQKQISSSRQRQRLWFAMLLIGVLVIVVIAAIVIYR